MRMKQVPILTVVLSVGEQILDCAEEYQIEILCMHSRVANVIKSFNIAVCYQYLTLIIM